jgi:Protein of unknown function (DUF3617)
MPRISLPRYVLLSAAAVVVIGLSAALIAQQPRLDVKVGLWEITSRMQVSGMTPVPAIDTSSMTPEQRAIMQNAMKSAMDAMQGTHVTKQCLTAEDLSKPIVPPDEDNNRHCQETIVSSSSSVQDVKVECTGEMPSHGEIRFERVTSESAKGTVTMTAGPAGGERILHSTLTAKWLGADCGTIK